MRRRANFLFHSILCCACVAGVPAYADAIEVPIDQVRTVVLQKPAKTVYIGNPTIADVTVIDSRHVFILGKTFGETNLMALDASGQQTTDDPVVVTGRPGLAISVHRGIARTTLICTPAECEAAPAPGDDATSPKDQQHLAQPPYDALIGQTEKRDSDNMRAAEGK